MKGGRWEASVCLSTSLSKHFVLRGVRATGLQSAGLLEDGFFGTGMIVVDVREEGTVATRDVQKMAVKKRESWFQHALSTFPGTLMGPAAFLRFTTLRNGLTSCCCIVRAGLTVARRGGEQNLLASNRAKKLISSSASRAAFVVFTAFLLPLQLVKCCKPCHTHLRSLSKTRSSILSLQASLAASITLFRSTLQGGVYQFLPVVKLR